MSRRKHTPSTVETELLVRSRRRCCVCFGLDRDQAAKKGQIAHLDGDPANASIENLAWLCLDHHDEYDGRPSQAKGLTIHEVKTYRAELYEHITQLINYAGHSSPAFVQQVVARYEEMLVHREKGLDALRQQIQEHTLRTKELQTALERAEEELKSLRLAQATNIETALALGGELSAAALVDNEVVQFSVLLVEYHESIARSLKAIFGSVGHHLTYATSVEQANKFLAEAQFDAIISEANMPGSYEMIARAATKLQTPTVVLTAYDYSADREKAMDAGAAEFLAKPTDVDHLLKVVERIVQQAKVANRRSNQ